MPIVNSNKGVNGIHDADDIWNRPLNGASPCALRPRLEFCLGVF